VQRETNLRPVVPQLDEVASDIEPARRRLVFAGLNQIFRAEAGQQSYQCRPDRPKQVTRLCDGKAVESEWPP